MVNKSPVWSQQGIIEKDSVFRVYRYESSDGVKVYTIVEKPANLMTDDACPSTCHLSFPANPYQAMKLHGI